MEKMLFVSGNCSDLAKENVELKLFPDGESYVRMPGLEKGRGKHAFILHRCYPDQDRSLIQLFLMLRTLNGIAKKITAIVPYFPYARQDKMFLEGEAKSAEHIAGMMKECGCDELITFDCHFLRKLRRGTYGGLPIVNISMNKQLIDYFGRKEKDILPIAPDGGAAYLVKDFGGEAMRKRRGGYSKGNVAMREIAEIGMDFDVSGRNVLILDDMISGGGTMVKAVELCRKRGAKRVFCAATHGLFLGDSLKKIRKAGADEVVVSDSIMCSASKVTVKYELRRFL